MLDPFHYYSREEALALGRGLEKLDYYWMEEPMDEHSTVVLCLADRTARPADLRAGDRRGQDADPRRMDRAWRGRHQPRAASATWVASHR